MSNQINLAGKNIVVDSIKETRKTSSSLQSIRSAYDIARAKGTAYKILDLVDETIDTVHDELSETISDVAGDLRDLTEDVNDNLKVEIQTVADDLGTLTTTVTDKLDDTTGTVITSLNTLVDQVGGTQESGLKTLIEDTGTTLTTYVDDTNTDIEGTISSTSASLTKYVDDTSDTINQTITTKEGELKTYAEDKRDEAKAYTDDAKEEIDQTIAGVQDDLDDLADAVSGQNEEVTKTLCRIGARLVVRNSAYQIDVYAYNPRKPYHYFDITDPDAYQDDYYTSAGFVTCDGANLPVAISGNYTAFSPNYHGGMWVIAIYKANVQDEAYTPIILCPYANGQVMEWRKTDNTVMSSMLDVWIIGNFKVTYQNSSVTGLSDLYISQNGIAPSTFLKNRFMWLMNDADGTPTQDFTDWAIAMGCDQIFSRLAALEMFVNKLYANNLFVGTANAFEFTARTYDNNGNYSPIFDVKNNGTTLFKVCPNNGNVFFGEPDLVNNLDSNNEPTKPATGFMYSPTDNALHSKGDKVVIDATGGLVAGSARISGSSIFSGDFDCTAIKTSIASPYVIASAAATTISMLQASDLYNAISALGYGTTYAARIQGVSSNIAFVQIGYSGGSGASWTKYWVQFLDASGDIVDIRNVLNMAVSSPSSGAGLDPRRIEYDRASRSWDTSGGSYATSSFTVELLAGGNTLTLNIPSSGTGLNNGQMFYGASTTVGGVTCYPLYMKA